MKLEVGMYVRFKDKRSNTYIRKIIDIPKDNRYASIYIDKEANYTNHLSFKNVLKASNSIIDLIEVGDYVNELPVEGYYTRYDEEKDDYIKIGIVTLEDYWKGTFTSVEDIKSIVTKEAFESMEYKLGDK